ncbi:hypothetical protein A2U01_0071913, partial [Trifolium medium]|nr:hypothetical protein [Trifolium medium]
MDGHRQTHRRRQKDPRHGPGIRRVKTRFPHFRKMLGRRLNINGPNVIPRFIISTRKLSGIHTLNRIHDTQT